MLVLVTGGLGYIGSHTVIELVQAGHEVVIADNLMNSKLIVLERLEKILGFRLCFYQVDVTDEVETEEIFKSHSFDAIIHFAALKSIGESVSKPLEYYFNNVLSTIVLSNLCIKYGVCKFVYSSSATVYGEQISPLHEEMVIQRSTNPYGETKIICERILSDISSVSKNFSVTLLRYFNPIGAHKSGLLGEVPQGVPNNLMPYITRVAIGELEELIIFGDDYDTPDGTGIRDYVHVVDLANGHVKALDNMNEGVTTYNLGTGVGTSVLELLHTFMSINNLTIPYKVKGRRPGDIAVSYANVTKAYHELGWKALLGIEDMVRDSWNFERLNLNTF